MTLPDKMTIGELYNPAMKITTQNEATEYLKMLIERRLRVSPMNENEAMKCELGNLGYYAGYFDPETYERVQRLFNCQHPIFGSLYPDANDAYKKGLTSNESL